MKITLLLCAIISFVGCSSRLDERIAVREIIREDDISRYEAALIELTGAANPMSDEEPEDNIAEAAKQLRPLYAVPVWGIEVCLIAVPPTSSQWAFIPYWECTDAQKQRIDNHLQPQPEIHTPWE